MFMIRIDVVKMSESDRRMFYGGLQWVGVMLLSKGTYGHDIYTGGIGSGLFLIGKFLESKSNAREFDYLEEKIGELEKKLRETKR